MLMIKNLRFVLLSMLMVLTGTVGAQKTVTLDFDNDYKTLFPTIEGTSNSANAEQGIEASTAGDFTGATTSTAVDGVTVTVAPAEDAKTASRIWGAAPRLRMYSGTFTVTAKDITKIEFTGHSTNFNLTTETGTLDGKKWVGKADEVVFAVAKNTQLNNIVVTLGGEVEVIEPSDEKVMWSEPFSESQGEFTINDVTKPEGLNYVWAFDSRYGMKASGYYQQAFDTESWIVSPVIDLTTATKATFTFEHTGRYFDTVDEEATVWVREENGEWAQQTVDKWFTEQDWNYVTATIDLTAFAGKKIQIGFKYTSTAAAAGTWEVKNLKIVGDGNAEQKPDDPVVEVMQISVAEALTIIDGLEDGKLTTEDYQVKGIVTSVTEISTEYGNATFVLSDDAAGSNAFTVFRAKGFGGERIADENIVKVGDEVVVEGKLQRYVKNDVMTPELAQGGKIVSVNGKSAGIEGISNAKAAQTYYNLQGQRVAAPTKGLYIVGGKKVVMK